MARDNIEMVVYIYLNDHNKMEICTDDGEILCIVDDNELDYILKPISVDNKFVYTFKRGDDENMLWSVSISRLKDILKNKNK